MAVTREETLTDLRKARVRKFVYFGAGIGLFCLGMALLVMFLLKRPFDWGALVLAIIGSFWGAIMLNQAMRAREIEDLIRARLEDLEEAGTPEAGGSGEADTEAEAGEADRAPQADQAGETGYEASVESPAPAGGPGEQQDERSDPGEP